eukprot:2936002-Amphidinium_carterae.1
MGNEYTAMSKKRCNVCRNSDYPVVLSKCILCKHHVLRDVHGKPGSNHQVRLGDGLDPHQPNRYVRCGATTTVGGDIICLKWARTNAWIRTEGWRALTEDELGDVWTNLPQQENEVVPGMNTSRRELMESDDPIPVEHIRLVT